MNTVVSSPGGALLTYLSNKPAFLIGQGFVSISQVNLLKGLLGKHMKKQLLRPTKNSIDQVFVSIVFPLSAFD